MIQKCECGAKITFVTSPLGKQMPVNISTPLYYVRQDGRATPLARLDKNGRCGYAVSHFATCPLAKKFSKKKPAAAKGAAAG